MSNNLTQEEIDSNAVHDELVTKQQEAIDREISSSTSLVSEKINLVSVLSKDYAKDEVYLKRIGEIGKTYDKLRRTRPDGNCFFRAFCFRVLERLVEMKQYDSSGEELKTFRDKVVASKDILTQAGFTQFTVEDFYDNFLDVVEKYISNTEDSTIEHLHAQFQEQSLADYLVVYLRILTSAELRRSADFYQNFIDGERTLEEFCQLEVEPMYKESDHIHIIALTTALGIGVRVVYMDRGGNTTSSSSTGGLSDVVSRHDFPDSVPPTIHLLYRPGHYDILYPIESTTTNEGGGSSTNGVS